METIEIRSAAGSKQALHFGGAQRPLLGFFHAPTGGIATRAAAVLLVSPIGTDHTRSDLTYRHLAERLAAEGFPCLRFDLSGTGDSTFEPEGERVASWLEDVRSAAAELRARCGLQTLSLVGLRLGGTLATLHAAEQGDVDSLVLWSPCVTGAAYVAEVTRLHKVYLRIEPHVAAAPAPKTAGQEALGAFLPASLVGELSGVDLATVAKRPARRTLLVDGGGIQGRDALVWKLHELGAEPEVQDHSGYKFLITVSHRQVAPTPVIEAIAKWLRDAYPKGTETRQPAPLRTSPGPHGERPVRFGSDGSLFGILTPADPEKGRAERPAIVVANAGCVNRAGPHAMFTKLARRWAALGFDVLRVDLSGIGDSPVRSGATENVTYPPSGLDDLAAAVATTGRKAIVVGLCSGGDYAFQLGAQGTNVVGAWLLNPRTFCVLDLVAVESGAPPAGSVDDVPRTLRGMADKGVDTVLVVSRNDPGVAYVDANAGSAMKALEDLDRFRRFDIDGADHPFTPITVQERVGDLLTERLLARHGG